MEAVTARIAHVHAGPVADLSEEVTRSVCHLPSLRETPPEGSPSERTYSGSRAQVPSSQFFNTSEAMKGIMPSLLAASSNTALASAVR